MHYWLKYLLLLIALFILTDHLSWCLTLRRHSLILNLCPWFTSLLPLLTCWISYNLVLYIVVIINHCHCWLNFSPSFIRTSLLRHTPIISVFPLSFQVIYKLFLLSCTLHSVNSLHLWFDKVWTLKHWNWVLLIPHCVWHIWFIHLREVRSEGALLLILFILIVFLCLIIPPFILVLHLW